MSEKKPFSERLAKWTRVALLAAIAVVLGLILTTPRDELSGYPRFMTRAQAEGIAANPGYVLTSVGVGNADKFYLVDTNKQVICVYGVTNDQLRLQAARKFDYDCDIPDGHMQVQAGAKQLKLEGGNGLNREDAKAYGDQVKIDIEKLKKAK